MSERTLVSVRTIDSVHEIPGADRIEAAVIGGWTTVTGKGEFKAGDRCMFFEVDSCLPISDPRFKFLLDRGTKDLPDGTPVHRLKTVRLRGVYSQGLALPLDQFDDVLRKGAQGSLAKRLGVVKWEPPQGKYGLGKMDPAGSFPDHIARRTDSERVQNLTEVWAGLHNYRWFATEKVDGTSLTVARDHQGELFVSSRNYVQNEGENVYWAAVHKYELDRVGPGEALQAEIYGPGIQGNPLKMNDRRVAVFGYSRDRIPLPRNEWPSWLAVEPIVPEAPWYEDLTLPETVAEAIEQVDGIKSLISPGRAAEGVVWWTVHATPVMALDWRPNFKVVSNKYLLKEEEREAVQAAEDAEAA